MPATGESVQANPIDQTWRRGDLARLVRLFSMGATVVYAVLGMATATGSPTYVEVTLGVAVGISFHLFAFPLNDVLDLPIDRTNERRAEDPLVRGLASPKMMLLIAVFQLPVMAVLLFAAGVGATTFLFWGVAVVGLGAYDLWGKRLRVPLLADIWQGVGFAALVMMGAHWTGGPTPVSWLVAGYIVVYIVQINAVHGGLRDIVNDVAHGARTTPVLLGCGVDEEGTPVMSLAMAVAALATEALMFMILAAVLATVDRTGDWWAALPSIAIGLRIFGSWIGWRAYLARADRPRLMALGVWHLFWSLTAIVVAVLGEPAAWVAAAILAVYLLPPGWFARLSR